LIVQIDYCELYMSREVTRVIFDSVDMCSSSIERIWNSFRDRIFKAREYCYPLQMKTSCPICPIQ